MPNFVTEELKVGSVRGDRASQPVGSQRSIPRLKLNEIDRTIVELDRGIPRVSVKSGELHQGHDTMLVTAKCGAVENYKTFSIHTSNSNKDSSTARHDVLVMKRDPNLADLKNLLALKIESTEVGITEMASQIPNVVYRER